MSKRRHLIIMIIWAALLTVAVIVFWGRMFPNDGDVPVHPAPIQTDERSAKTHTAPALARLVGRWRRPDGGYILDIKAVHDDGKLDAAYLNPRPIHVARAEAITKGGYVIVVVTLRDRGYPGSMYTLTYDAEADRLKGVYHQRELNQQFNVEFSRVKKP